MIKNMLTDLKLAAMDVVGDIKDVAHDAMTTLPDEKVVTFNNEGKKQSIESGELNYMSGGWSQIPAQMTANRIDMIAEKIAFVSEMIATGLISFDSVEQELINVSRGNTPPTPAQLQSIAARIDTNQKQIYNGLKKLNELAKEIDVATDKLQGGQQSSTGWGTKGVGTQMGTGWY